MLGEPLDKQRGFARTGRGRDEDQRRFHPLLEVLDQAGAPDEPWTQVRHLEFGGQPPIVQAMRESKRGFPICHYAGEGRGLR